MNITASILNKLKTVKTFPVEITNKDYPIIQESAIIVQHLEGEGYKVETFVDLTKQTYGFRINK